MAVPVPSSFDAIDATWLNSALAETGVITAEVAALTLDPLPEGKGLMGDLARLHLTYSSGTGPETMIVKLPAAEPGSRRVGAMLNAWGREGAFYTHVAPRSVGARLPRCFHAGEDLDLRRWVLVIEECPADEFDFFAGATAAQATAAVDALATFHALWWQSNDRFDWMPGFDTGGVGGLQPLWLESLPVFLDRYAHVVPEPTAEWVLSFVPHLSDWSSRAAAEPLTMTHADYRIDNILFDGNQVTMIDWQTAMRAPAAIDLSCFIATSLSIELRTELEDQLVDRYLAGLMASGVAVDHGWFTQSYDESLLWWMGQFGNNLAHLYPPDETVQHALEVMVERVYATALARNVGRLL